MRAGLRAVLRAKPGFVPLDAATNADELPILGMTIEDTPVLGIAATLGVEPTEVAHRIDRMIKRLKVDVPAPRIAG